MTAVLNRGDIATVAPTGCPPWCVRADGHDSTDGSVYHEGRETAVKFGDPYISVTVAASRDDKPDRQGDPYVWMSADGLVGTGHDWVENLTPAAAVQLGRALIAAAGKVTGFKRADDLRIGDRIVLDGHVHEVVFLMVDACYHDDVDVRCCEGTVQIHTDLSESVDESDPAATCEAGDLVQMEATP